MKKDFTRPKWWLLYLSNVLVLGFFWLEVKASLSETGHKLVEVGLVIILYGLMMVWIKANEVGLMNEDWEKYKKEVAWDVLESSHPNHRYIEIRSGNGCHQGLECRLERKLGPTSLTSLVGNIITLFKPQEQ
jgi:hypothetical protein